MDTETTNSEVTNSEVTDTEHTTETVPTTTETDWSFITNDYGTHESGDHENAAEKEAEAFTEAKEKTEAAIPDESTNVNVETSESTETNETSTYSWITDSAIEKAASEDVEKPKVTEDEVLGIKTDEAALTPAPEMEIATVAEPENITSLRQGRRPLVTDANASYKPWTDFLTKNNVTLVNNTPTIGNMELTQEDINNAISSGFNAADFKTMAVEASKRFGAYAPQINNGVTPLWNDNSTGALRGNLFRMADQAKRGDDHSELYERAQEEIETEIAKNKAIASYLFTYDKDGNISERVAKAGFEVPEGAITKEDILERDRLANEAMAKAQEAMEKAKAEAYYSADDDIKGLTDSELLDKYLNKSISRETYNEEIMRRQEIKESTRETARQKLASGEALTEDEALELLKTGEISSRDYSDIINRSIATVTEENENKVETLRNEAKEAYNEYIETGNKEKLAEATGKLAEASNLADVSKVDISGDAHSLTLDDGTKVTLDELTDTAITSVMERANETSEKATSNKYTDEERASTLKQLLIDLGIPVVSSTLQFFTDLFGSDWDERNTASGNEYAEITSRLKENLASGGLWNDIKSLIKAAKEYKEATENTKMYETLRNAQRMVGETLVTALGIATGNVGTVLALIGGKNLLRNLVSVMKDTDTEQETNELTEAVSSLSDSDFSDTSSDTTVETPELVKNWDKEDVSTDVSGYNKGLEEEVKQRQEVPSDVFLKVFKKEPASFAWIRNV